MTRTRTALITATALGSLWAGGSELAHSAPILSEVVRETRANGWPHESTTRERAQASRAVLWAHVPYGEAGRVLCKWPTARMGSFTCGVVRGRARYKVAVKVWEDGSYRIIRIKGGK
jgi:hypothetical protein